MIIGIDGNEANIKERVGVHQYAFEILWGLYKLQDINNPESEFVIYLKNTKNADLPPQKQGWKYKIIRGGRLWILTRLMPKLLLSEKIDVFFSPNHYLPLFINKPLVCTIHDLGYLDFSGQFKKNDIWQLKYWSAISIIISKYIICPSRSTREMIVRHYPFAVNKVKIVYHGYDYDNYNIRIPQKLVRQVADKYRIRKNYILFLSTLKPSKNIEGLIEAYSTLKNNGDRHLVIAGKKGWLYERIFKKVKELGLEKDVVFTDYISEEDKRGLIRGSVVFVLPSFWEGFGMDILEAMACGVPVVVSKVASLPEVAGDAAVYVDPYNIDSIAKGIGKVLDMSTNERKRMINKGLKQAEMFNWKKSAAETLKVLTEAGK